MKKLSTNSFLGKLIFGAKKEAPTILIGVGVAGVVTTIVLAIRATPKAIELLDEERARRFDIAMKEAHANGEDLEDVPENVMQLGAKTYFMLLWRPYLPVAISGGLTITSIIASHVISEKRMAVLAGLVSSSEALLAKYQEKVVEQIGENKERAIRDAIAEDDVRKAPPIMEHVQETKYGPERDVFKDLRTGRYFWFDIERLRSVENDVLALLNAGERVTLNEFYDMLGLGPVEDGEMLGWEPYSHFNITKTWVGFEEVDPLNGLPFKRSIVAISFDNRPTDVYETYS